MKKSHAWIVAGLFGAIAVVAWAKHVPLTTFAPLEAGEVGRYSLFQAPYVYVDGEMADVIFRVDTQTGRTWRYLPPIEDPNSPEGWLAIPELIEE